MADSEPIDLDYLAQLSRLELSEDEKTRFGEQLGQVLEHFKKIDSVDVSGVEPTAHAFPVFNVWDEDVAVQGFTQEEALANAPAKREGQVSVPKVIES